MRLFDDAIDQLLQLQAVPVPDDFPPYDEALLLRELRLFDEWFLGNHLAIVPDVRRSRRTSSWSIAVLIDAALAQPQVFVHRDFMPRNLMPARRTVRRCSISRTRCAGRSPTTRCACSRTRS